MLQSDSDWLFHNHISAKERFVYQHRFCAFFGGHYSFLIPSPIPNTIPIPFSIYLRSCAPPVLLTTLYDPTPVTLPDIQQKRTTHGITDPENIWFTKEKM